MLAKNSQAPRLFRKYASSLTFFASKLAPTEGMGQAQYPRSKSTSPRSACLA